MPRRSAATGGGRRARTRHLGRGLGAAACLVVLVAFAACERSGALVGQPAPDFALPTLGGETVRLANLQGRVVFLNLWATWCEPCRAEMPAMQRLYERLGGADFEVLAVSADQGPVAAVTAFVGEHALTFPVLRDPELQVASRYRVTGYPETFVIDRNGRIVEHVIGPWTWDSPESVAAFRKLIATGEWAGL